MGQLDEVAALLQRLAEQQAALLRAYEETARVQRLALERLLAAYPAAGEAPPPPSADTTAPAGADVPTPAPLPASPAPEQATPIGRQARAWSGKTPQRAPRSPEPPAELGLLRRLLDAGSAAGYILQFGQYQGLSLRYVALQDPAYLRSLAETAQRPDVRAAARAVAQQLEEQRSRRPAAGSKSAAKYGGYGRRKTV